MCNCGWESKGQEQEKGWKSHNYTQDEQQVSEVLLCRAAVTIHMFMWWFCVVGVKWIMRCWAVSSSCFFSKTGLERVFFVTSHIQLLLGSVFLFFPQIIDTLTPTLILFVCVCGSSRAYSSALIYFLQSVTHNFATIKLKPTPHSNHADHPFLSAANSSRRRRNQQEERRAGEEGRPPGPPHGSCGNNLGTSCFAGKGRSQCQEKRSTSTTTHRSWRARTTRTRRPAAASSPPRQ